MSYYKISLDHLQPTLNDLKARCPKNIKTEKLIKLLYKSLAFKNKWDFQSKELPIQMDVVVGRITHVLANPPEQKQKELHTFYKKMCKERKHLFTFLWIAVVNEQLK